MSHYRRNRQPERVITLKRLITAETASLMSHNRRNNLSDRNLHTCYHTSLGYRCPKPETSIPVTHRIHTHRNGCNGRNRSRHVPQCLSVEEVEAADGVLSGLWPWALEGAGGGHPTPLSNLVRLLAAACRRGTPALYHMLKVARCVVRCWSVSSGGEAGCRVWQPCSLQFTGGVRPGSLRRCAARQFTGGVRPGCLGAACGQAVLGRSVDEGRSFVEGRPKRSQNGRPLVEYPRTLSTVTRGRPSVSRVCRYCR